MTTEPIDACAAAIARVIHPDWSWNDLRPFYQGKCRETARACLKVLAERAGHDDADVQAWLQMVLDGKIHAITKQED